MFQEDIKTVEVKVILISINCFTKLKFDQSYLPFSSPFIVSSFSSFLHEYTHGVPTARE